MTEQSLCVFNTERVAIARVNMLCRRFYITDIFWAGSPSRVDRML